MKGENVLGRLLRRDPGALTPEVIGPPECPIMHRWTLLGGDRQRADGTTWQRPVKLLLHHFLPGSGDRDQHNHPRPFWTIVLRGEYLDESTDAEGRTVREVMTQGTARLRPSHHRHRTLTSPDQDCWTLVLMGPVRRPWGFWRGGRFWPYRAYKARFGEGMRCP